MSNNRGDDHDEDDQRRLLAEDDANDADEDITYVDGSGLHRSAKDNHAFDYRIAIAFTILGAGMLWPFNSFITANEFFARIFAHSPFLLRIYSPAITSLFTCLNLVSTAYYTSTVRKADLHARVSRAALTATILFAVLAICTVAKFAATAYFTLVMVIVAASAILTGSLSNGTFGLVGGYGPLYVQYVMIGQGIAGVTPAILSIVVALIDRHPGQTASRRAFAYFLSSSLVLASSFFAHAYLRSRRDAPDAVVSSAATSSEQLDMARYRALLKGYHPWSIFLAFAVTLSIFPTLTASVTSTLPTEHGVPFKDLPKYLQPSVFIPIGFFLFNGGDLLARVLSVIPALTIERPRILFTASLLRVAFIPLVFLCNIRAGGAIVKNDAFFFGYMLALGMSNGYLGSLTYAAALKHAKEGERRDVGAFMTLMLCLGLVAGSLISFLF